MRRRLLRIALILLVLLFLAGAVLLLWPRDRITRASFKEIRIGMTEREVESLLDGRGSNRKSAELFPFMNGNLQNIDFETCQWLFPGDFKIWEGSRGAIALQFDPGGNVRGLLWIGRRDESIWDRLRAWLR
jgi:hypothetical protein